MHPLDGRGHVTCVRLADGEVSEAFVPASSHTVGITDITQRPWEAVWKGIVGGNAIHGGVCNTAVVHDGGEWFAVEEASHRYRLEFEDGKLTGSGTFEPRMHGPHTHGCRYHYLATRGLEIDDVALPWMPTPRPFAMHSCAQVGDLVVFPIMRTCFGSYEKWLLRMKSLPVRTAPSGWLVYDKTSRLTYDIRGGTETDVFHIACAKRTRDGRLAVFASHVHNFAEFVTDPGRVPKITFEKHVVDLKTKGIQERVVYDEASGDFPQKMSEDMLLMNTMKLAQNGGSVLVLFDTARERVSRRITLPHVASDVLCLDHRHLIYATMDEVVIYDFKAERVRRAYPIPRRTANFHASLLRSP